MSVFTIYRSQIFPIDIIKNLLIKKNSKIETDPLKEELLNLTDYDYRNKEPLSAIENKKSYFEITSVESSSRMSSVHDEYPNTTRKSTNQIIYMKRIHNFHRARWTVEDFKIPDFDLTSSTDANIDFIDDKSDIIWKFCSSSLSNFKSPTTSNRLVAPETIETIAEKSTCQNPRFFVTVTKNTSSDSFDATKKLSNIEELKPAALPAFLPAGLIQQGLVNEIQLTQNSASPSKGARTSKNILNETVSDKTIPIQSCTSADSSQPLNPTNLTVNAIPGAIVLTDNNKNMSSQPDLPSAARVTEDFVSYRFLVLLLKMALSIIAYPDMLIPTTLRFEKVSRVNLTTLSTLSSQISVLSDHIIELNTIVFHMRNENERLKHQLLRSRSPGRTHNTFNTEIVRAEDNSVNLLVEVIPGRKRIINLTRYLTPEEIDYADSLQK
ncbi:hypothetical protein HZS_6758 [Henneguya salminicola]|nr:hypothetical protein HZS_6758 [Henneguya salminicola]